MRLAQKNRIDLSAANLLQSTKTTRCVGQSGSFAKWRREMRGFTIVIQRFLLVFLVYWL